ncbi:MAG: ATP-grasp domain-containing protein [Xanthobacteraceae bacterium]|nr:ATP-grasp domain-containing protein [Xanthobacteraceae bacterium]MCW5677479.1 ATP-grasp domain-containing protein [Xanthobacteraceae bacterium]
MNATAAFPLKSVLIANRGEIACRVIRTAKAMGMRTIAVYSDADCNALHVKMADEAYAIGPAPARESYLVIDKIIAVAKAAKADCIHPGYGFLSERAEFAEACAAAGIVFVGPPPAAIRAMGLKGEAKALMAAAKVPVLPGYHGATQDPKFLKQKAYETGYPVLIKAAAGGGGKGMRRVDKQIEFDNALEAAKREAEAAFGNPDVLIEKYVASPRHIEVQVFADTHGNVVHLFERDCSAQRRHQKVIEEAPAPGMPDDVRAHVTKAAIEAARAVNYVGAGTVEFLADGSNGLRADAIWFLEMNTRLQVEHPVSELITNTDLVHWQFLVAAGEKLPLPQDKIRIHGHAVEARIYAEDAARGFLPSTGKLSALRFPGGNGIRVDSGVEQGGEVTPFYDPMIAKLIAYGATREQAFDRLSEALGGTVISGPRSNVEFLRALADSAEMRAGTVDTGYIERNLEALTKTGEADFAAAAFAVEELMRREQGKQREAARLLPASARRAPWSAQDGYDFGAKREIPVSVLVNGTRAIARVRQEGNSLRASVNGVEASPSEIVEAGDLLVAIREGRQTGVKLAEASSADLSRASGNGAVSAPMHGKVLSVSVAKGDKVAKGQRLMVLEAMKMEHALDAATDGVVAELSVAAGEQVSEGAQLILIKPEKAQAKAGA